MLLYILIYLAAMAPTTAVYAITGANRGLGFEFAKQAGPIPPAECKLLLCMHWASCRHIPLSEISAALSEAHMLMQLLEAGNTVVATCRSPRKAEALDNLAESHKGRLIIQALDVNDEASVKVPKPCSVLLSQNLLSKDIPVLHVYAIQYSGLCMPIDRAGV